jgi:hypothetical protein
MLTRISGRRPYSINMVRRQSASNRGAYLQRPPTVTDHGRQIEAGQSKMNAEPVCGVPPRIKSKESK